MSRLTDEFAYSNSGGHRYHAEVKLDESDEEGVRVSLRQTTNTTGDRCRSASVRNTPAAMWKSSVPANYIPGELLPLVMGKIRATTPLIVRTDSFPGGCEAVGPANC